MKKKLFAIFKIYIITSLALISLQTKAQIPNVTNGFIGNTFSGSDNKFVQNYAEELDVASDGTMITASEWDEAGRCVGIFKDGQPVAYLKQFNGVGGHDCWGWGTSTKATAVDDNYLYLNDCNGDLQRYNRANNYSYVDSVNVGLAEGMTVSGSFLYMITPTGLIQKRSVSNLKLVALSFTVTGGYDLAVDNAGNIWVLTTNKEVLKYTSAGVNTGTKIAAQSGWLPSAVNYDAFNDFLLVPDNGPRRQVIKFNTLGVQVGTFGDLGGISAGSKGVVGDLRFWNISGCGTDANGNIYTALNENCVSLRKFNSDGVKQWEVLGTMFSDITSIDPASDGNDIYGINEHMKFNYSTQQWSLTSMTCDRVNNPNDPRNIKTGTKITSAIMRRVNSNLIMYTTGMYAGGFDVYRFDGEIAVFADSLRILSWSALPDKNGNIWYESGGRIKKIPLTGFSGGNPVFGADVNVTTTLTAPITKIERVEYDADKDVMYIAGWTKRNPNRNNNWGLIGSTIARYPNWSTGNRTASNTVVLTKDVEGLYPKAMSVADGYVFVGGSRDRGKLYVYNSSNLSTVGFIASPTNMGEIGWIDMPYAVQAFKKSNGVYVITVEDNSKGKNIVYQWCPTGNCVVVNNVTISPSFVSLSVNANTPLNATILPNNATNKNLIWTSSNNAIAKVNSSGVVTGISAGGPVTITVSCVADPSKKATCAVTVTAPLTWTTIENTNTGWFWSGFEVDACSACSGGSSHSASLVNSYGEYTFTGTDIELYCENWVGSGSMQVFIDGVSNGTFSQSGVSKFATISGLSNTSHVLKVVSADSNWPSIDYLRITGTPSAVSRSASSVVELETSLGKLSIYPNPATNWVTIDFNGDLNEETAEVVIIDMMGRSVYQSGKLSHVSKLSVSTQGYSNGSYIVNVSKGKERITRKLIIGH